MNDIHPNPSPDLAVTARERRASTVRAKPVPGAARVRATGGVVCAVLLLAGCGGSEGDDASPPPATETTPATNGETTAEQPAEDLVITIADYEYEVPESVPAGAEITVRNEDSVNHTVTDDDEELFDVNVEAGGEATFTVPDEPGDYGFFCRPHPYMTDTLVVE